MDNLKVVWRAFALSACVLVSMVTRANTSVEFPVWERSYTGTVAGKQVEVKLSRTNNALEGYYCYAPCGNQKSPLILSGLLDNESVNLNEKQGDKPTGLWALRLNKTTLQGSWSSPNKKRSYPVSLIQTTDPLDPGIELSLVADHLVKAGEDDCGQATTVSAIKLYKDGKLFQELNTESTGTCGIFLPSWQDVNFDGHLDLSIALFLPAGPNIPQQTWLYDPKIQRYIDAPTSYQEITSPDIDPKYKQISSFWRSSCCSHGVTVYHWQGNEVVQVDVGESFQQPVISQGKLLTCYVIPEYQDGRIVYPVQRHNGKLKPFKVDKEVCGELMTTEQLKSVIQPEQADRKPETLEIKWLKQEGETVTYCPQIPFVDGDKITYRLVTDKEVNDICLDEEAFHS